MLPDARMAAPSLLPAPSAAPFSPMYPSPSGKATFTPAQQELTKAVRDYLRSSQAGASFSALDELQRVLKDLTPDGTEPSNRASEVFLILRSQTDCIASSSSSRGSGAARAQLAALEGSIKHLESSYLKLMEQRVRADRQMAMAGGTGSITSLIQGFVTSSSRAVGGKVFVPLGRQALAWQQVSQSITSLNHCLGICCESEHAVKPFTPLFTDARSLPRQCQRKSINSAQIAALTCSDAGTRDYICRCTMHCALAALMSQFLQQILMPFLPQAVTMLPRSFPAGYSNGRQEGAHCLPVQRVISASLQWHWCKGGSLRSMARHSHVLLCLYYVC